VSELAAPTRAWSREQIVHSLYEAAELEHNLMCTYLYAAFSLKDGDDVGLGAQELAAVTRWKRTILDIAIEEMSHLAAVWNITVALGAAPRIGRANFPIDPGYLPASVVVKLAPFNRETLQHFIYLERPIGSDEPEGDGFRSERPFERSHPAARLTPMAVDYATVGEFYQVLKQALVDLAGRVGEPAAFAGDARLQLAGAELGLPDARPVRCLATALQAFDSIVAQGEGSQADSTASHYQRFCAIRAEFESLLVHDPAFAPAHPAATNPVLRRPPRPEGRVWIEDPRAIATVDLANASYGLMLRLLAHAYAVPADDRSREAVLMLALGLMHAITPLAEEAVRLPAGTSHPDCHAGMSFTALRDAAALPPGPAARRFFVERFAELSAAGSVLAREGSPRIARAAQALAALAVRAGSALPDPAPSLPASGATASVTATPVVEVAGATTDTVEIAAGRAVEIQFRGRRCIHARFCVTGAPRVFLANVQGPWIRPDEMPAERLVEIAHACPSGAIQYRRLDGQPGEVPPPVNLAAVREAGPYAFRGDLRIRGEAVGFRATLCRCGASRQKPFCDGSHHAAEFRSTGEPPTGTTDALPARDGVLEIEPEPNGPLALSGNLEILSGTGRVVARVTRARLCRCGGSQTKPFCDLTHARIGFRA
jgi:CDGSH-type Zn-finger protein/uncharacterized Fe-S cluster protein YjdI